MRFQVQALDRSGSGSPACRSSERERVLHWRHTCPNLLNRRDDFSRLALRHGSLNSLFQVARPE